MIDAEALSLTMQAIEFEAIIETACWVWNHEAGYAHLTHHPRRHRLQ